LEHGGGTVGAVGMKSVEWEERDRIEKTMIDREKNVKKREREVEEKDAYIYVYTYIYIYM
jgi:hypothetical protein